MIYLVGNVESDIEKILKSVFEKFGYTVGFKSHADLADKPIISLTKEASRELEKQNISFFNWDLLLSVLGPNDTASELEGKIIERLKVLQSFENLKSPKSNLEFHGSIRVKDLASSTRFYTWLFGVEPKEWTHRYVTFQRLDTKFNFVLLVSDGKDLHHDTLYHLGIGVESKLKVIEFYHSAKENGFHIEKPPRTTWRGTPLHELWLKDPDGTLIEIYSRLNSKELEAMPEDKEPLDLV